jgi:hypothetical protein
VPHVIEPAASGRAKCRGCGEPIAQGEWRLGERLPNPFAEGEMSLWFHLRCAAYKRPQPLLEALAATDQQFDEREALAVAAQQGLDHRRLPRIDGAERASSGRAKCRSCKEPIPRGAWRVRLVFFEDGRFDPGGFIHLDCRAAYFETEDIEARLRHFSPQLDPADLAELARALA